MGGGSKITFSRMDGSRAAGAAGFQKKQFSISSIAMARQNCFLQQSWSSLFETGSRNAPLNFGFPLYISGTYDLAVFGEDIFLNCLADDFARCGYQ